MRSQKTRLKQGPTWPALEAKLTQLQELLDPASPEITNRIAEIEHLEIAKNSRIPLGTQLQRKLNQVKGLDQRMGKLQARIKTKEDQRDEIHKDLSDLQNKNMELQGKIDSAMAESQALTLAYQKDGNPVEEPDSDSDDSMDEGKDPFRGPH